MNHRHKILAFLFLISVFSLNSMTLSKVLDKPDVGSSLLNSYEPEDLGSVEGSKTIQFKDEYKDGTFHREEVPYLADKEFEAALKTIPTSQRIF